MDGGYEWVTRERTKPGFRVDPSTATTLSGERLKGYGFSTLFNIASSWILKTKNSINYIAPLAYNPQYFDYIQRLKKKGFVESLNVRWMYYDYPKVISYQILSTGRGPFDARGTGASSMVLPEVGYDIALSKALGELLERDAARYRTRDDVDFPATKKVPLPFPIADIPGFTAGQRAYSNKYLTEHDTDAAFESVKVKNLTTGDYAWLPLQYIFYGKRPGGDEGEKIVVESTTNGCGGGFTKEQASVSALCELIERDHFMLWWFSGLAPQRISLDGSTTELAKKVKEAESRYGLEVYFLDTSYEMPLLSVVCVIIDPVLNIVGMGGKAGLSDDVLEGAYVEALTLLHSTRSRIDSGKRGDAFFKPNDFTDMALHQAERETQCCTPAAVSYIKKTFLSGQVIPYEKTAERFVAKENDKTILKKLVQWCAEYAPSTSAAHHVYLYEFNSPWLRECAYHAVRITIPSFLKLHLREGFAAPCSRRLASFLARHGRAYSEDAINRIPHFFP